MVLLMSLAMQASFIIPGLPTVIHLWRDRRHEIIAWIKARFRRKRPSEADPKE